MFSDRYFPFQPESRRSSNESRERIESDRGHLSVHAGRADSTKVRPDQPDVTNEPQSSTKTAVLEIDGVNDLRGSTR